MCQQNKNSVYLSEFGYVGMGKEGVNNSTRRVGGNTKGLLSHSIKTKDTEGTYQQLRYPIIERLSLLVLAR